MIEDSCLTFSSSLSATTFLSVLIFQKGTEAQASLENINT